jgi:membrane fusion protein (multidrug efflux system)
MKIPGKTRLIVLISSIILLQSCTKAAEGSMPHHQLLNFRFIPLSPPATTYQEFPTALEGKTMWKSDLR